jgi:hypothetical protein
VILFSLFSALLTALTSADRPERDRGQLLNDFRCRLARDAGALSERSAEPADLRRGLRRVLILVDDYRAAYEIEGAGHMRGAALKLLDEELRPWSSQCA